MGGVAKRPYAVVLGLSPPALYVVRELGRASVPVFGVARKAQSGASSKYLDDHRICGSDREMLDFLVDRFAGEKLKPVLIPTTDRDIDFVCRHARVLSRHFAFQTSYLDGLAQAMVTKASLYQLCADHGVAVARWLEVKCRELPSIEDQINTQPS